MNTKVTCPTAMVRTVSRVAPALNPNPLPRPLRS